MMSVRPSSCVTVKCWPLVTDTVPVNESSVPVVALSISDASVPGVFSMMLNALLLASQVPTLTFVPLKLNGKLTLKTTSGVVSGTFAGMAFWLVASGTCQRLPTATFCA